MARKTLSPRARALFAEIRALPDAANLLDVGAGVGELLQLIEWENPQLLTPGVDIGKPPNWLPNATWKRDAVAFC